MKARVARSGARRPGRPHGVQRACPLARGLGRVRPKAAEARSEQLTVRCSLRVEATVQVRVLALAVLVIWDRTWPVRVGACEPCRVVLGDHALGIAGEAAALLVGLGEAEPHGRH